MASEMISIIFKYIISYNDFGTDQNGNSHNEMLLTDIQLTVINSFVYVALFSCSEPHLFMIVSKKCQCRLTSMMPTTAGIADALQMHADCY